VPGRAVRAIIKCSPVEAVIVSVTQYYYRLHDDAVRHFRDSRDTFRLEKYRDSESIQLHGEECLLIDDLATHAKTGIPQKELVSRAISGFAGASLYDNDDYPFLIDRKTVAHASRLMKDIHPEDLRRACDLGRLKARYLEVEQWLWEDWGPNVFEKRLLPGFEMIRGLYCRAAERDQQVVVGWF
jgi:hypothetical protein